MVWAVSRFSAVGKVKQQYSSRHTRRSRTAPFLLLKDHRKAGMRIYYIAVNRITQNVMRGPRMLGCFLHHHSFTTSPSPKPASFTTTSPCCCKHNNTLRRVLRFLEPLSNLFICDLKPGVLNSTRPVVQMSGVGPVCRLDEWHSAGLKVWIGPMNPHILDAAQVAPTLGQYHMWLCAEPV